MNKRDRMVSRARRASDVAEFLRILADDIREISDNDDMSDAMKVKEANNKLDNMDMSEIESLLEEIQSWHDNMEGTNLESTGKLSELEDCVSELESIETDTLSVDEVDDISDVADQLEQRADNIDNISFPGMF